MLPFEIVSVLLLAAVIGGVFLAKREDDAEPSTSPIVAVDTAADRPRGAPPEMRQGEGYGG